MESFTLSDRHFQSGACEDAHVKCKSVPTGPNRKALILAPTDRAMVLRVRTHQLFRLINGEGCEPVMLGTSKAENNVEKAPRTDTRPTLLSASLEARVPVEEFQIAEDVELIQLCRDKLAKALDKFDAVELELGEGDLVVSFDSPAKAISCAIEMQSIIDAAMIDVPASSQCVLNVGIHHCEDDPSEDWLRGVGLRIGSTLRKLANGDILISAEVYSCIRELSGLRFVDRGSLPVDGEVGHVIAYTVFGTGGGAELIGGLAHALYLLGSKGASWLIPAVIIIALVVLYALNPNFVEDGFGELMDSQRIESIAVLPFDGTNLGAGSEPYGDVIRVRLTKSLMDFEGIVVFSPTTVAAAPDDEDSVTKARKRIEADGMLTGDARSAGSWLLVRGAILRVSDGSELWSRSYYRRVGDIDSIVDEMIADIALALKLRPSEGHGIASLPGGRSKSREIAEADLDEVREELEDALRELQTLSVDESVRVTSLNNLASLYYDSGRDEEALPLYREVIAIRELELGPDHPEVAVSLNNLASVYMASGRYSNAEPLYRRSLEIRLRTLGPHHPRVGNAMNNLASLLHRQGRHIEAEKLYKRALEIRALELELELGPESARLNDRAARLQLAGNYAAAAHRYEEALASEERESGKEHVRTGRLNRNLAVVRSLEGKDAESVSLFTRAISIFSRDLGSSHVRVARANSDLAEVHRKKERLGEAERYHEKALEAFELSLGVDHPEVAKTLGYLVAIFEVQGREEEAETARKRQQAIRESFVGPIFSYVAARTAQGSVIRDRLHDDLSMPQPVYEYQLEINLGELVAEKRGFADGLHNIGLLYIDLGRLDEAEQHITESLEIRQSISDGKHPEVAMSMHSLAKVYVLQERYSEALVRFKEALQIFEAALGQIHPYVARCWSDLAAALEASGHEGEAVYADGRARQAREALLAQ